MASLPSLAPCQHLTSLLPPVRSPPFANLSAGRALVVASSHANIGSISSCRFGCAWRWPSSIPTAVGACAAPSATTDNASGIGIIEFYRGKNILVIGGTGFLAKVFMEKILRTNPDIGKIFVMVKAKDTEAALKRLQTEVTTTSSALSLMGRCYPMLQVVDTELFKCLQEIHGKGYQSFVASKLVPVVGNVRESSLGISTELANEIAEEVDIIVNTAANTTFDERYDVAIDTNTLGPLRMISFAQQFKRLKLFLHVSTAYVNGLNQGVVLEKPLCLGETVVGSLGSSDFSEHKNTVLDIEAEIKLAFDFRGQSKNSASFHKKMKILGIQRAKLHGWQDTYVFTKAMGEMVMNAMRGEIPVVTIRPSIIESTVQDPFPGWIQGNRMMDPNILYYGKGQMRCFLADPNCVLDVVPVDMVVNAMVAVMARHGGGTATATGPHVYHVTSSTVNPMVVGDLLRFMYQHFSKSPIHDIVGQPILVHPASTVGSMEDYIRYVQSNLLQEEGNREGISSWRVHSPHHAKAMEEKIMHLSRVYEPYTFWRSRFDSTNTEALFKEMSAQERERFHFDMKSIDWMDYITNVHIPGLRKHVLKEGQQQERCHEVMSNPVIDAASLLH